MPTLHATRVIPVVDVAEGRVVHAVRGARSTYQPVKSALCTGSDPVRIARALLDRVAGAHGGSPVMYMADLDALAHRNAQHDVAAALLRLDPGLALWLDAGFRNVDDAGSFVGRLGAEGARLHPVFGTETLADAHALQGLRDFEGAILSLDSRDGARLDPAGAWERPSAWPGTVIAMTLDRVGTRDGPDWETFVTLRQRAPGHRWVGSGGLRDAAQLERAGRCGAWGWLVASGLHDGSLSTS